jgi:hypothetical protein
MVKRGRIGPMAGSKGFFSYDMHERKRMGDINSIFHEHIRELST